MEGKTSREKVQELLRRTPVASSITNAPTFIE
jgi:hypothetical protein